jgi:hypothetical protein
MTDKELLDAIGTSDMPRLVGEIRRLQSELEFLQEESTNRLREVVEKNKIIQELKDRLGSKGL